MQEYNKDLLLDILNNKNVSFSKQEKMDLSNMVKHPGFTVYMRVIDKFIADATIDSVFNQEEEKQKESKYSAVAMYKLKLAIKSFVSGVSKSMK